MICNQNEKYLLRYISSQTNSQNNNNELMDVIFKLGIKLNFKNTNPIYQIIDELNYTNYYAN
ncbi:MAG: hypothetical protein IJW73_03665 [Candidatus Gastranaerophilales bacterium]|nr:hypothetical protein [Candidatus Gastranaerophilales bacterium]